MAESLEYYKQQLEKTQASFSSAQSKYQALRRKYASLSQAEFDAKPDVAALKGTLDRFQSNISSLSSKIAAMGSKALAGAQDAVMDNLKGGLKAAGVSADAAKSALANKSNELMGALNNELTNIQNDVVSKISSSSIGALASGAKSAVSNLFAPETGAVQTNASLSTAKSDVGTAETDSKIKSISSDDNTAIAQTVAFVTKPVTESVTSAKSAETSIKKEPIPLVGQIATEAAKLKESGITDGSWDSTITSITNDLSSKIRTASEAVNNAKNDVLGGLNNSLGDLSGSLANGISNTIDFAAPVLAPIGSAIKAGDELTKSVIDVLPDSVGKYVQSRVDNFAAETSAAILGDKLNSMKKIASLLPGVTDTSTLWSIVGGLSGEYPQQTNVHGKDMRSAFGSADADTADVLYSVANTICSNVNRPDSFNFGQNKDLYDTLLQLASSLGLTDLVNQLSKCTSGENAYFDNRTLNLLKSSAKEAASRGDISTYKTIADNIGSLNLPDSRKDMAIIAGNIVNKNIEEDKPLWEATIDTLGIEANSVVERVTSVGTAYMGDVVSLMAASNTAIVDGITTTEDRALAQAAMYTYA